MNLSLQMPLTMAATGTHPFSSATRASPVSRMAGVVTNVRCSGGSFQTGTLTFFLSVFLCSAASVPTVYHVQGSCGGLLVCNVTSVAQSEGSRSAEWCDGFGYRRFAEVLGNDELGCTQ